LVKWEIEVGRQDILFINKIITGGPEKIERYLEFARKL
jgi:hypothetical protein